jgi:hypothetical protein
MNRDEISVLIGKFDAAQLHRKALDAEAEAALKLEKELEWAIIHELADMRLEKATYQGTTVEPKKETFPHVTDWDQFWNFIYENKFIHLLEKRPTVTGYRELLELGRAVPGVVPFVKTRLSVRRK